MRWRLRARRFAAARWRLRWHSNRVFALAHSDARLVHDIVESGRRHWSVGHAWAEQQGVEEKMAESRRTSMAEDFVEDELVSAMFDDFGKVADSLRSADSLATLAEDVGENDRLLALPPPAFAHSVHMKIGVLRYASADLDEDEISARLLSRHSDLKSSVKFAADMMVSVVN